MTYKDAIDWLYSTQMFGIKLGLEGPTRLLREFLAFPRHGVKVIQVAGTNGKGSTCAFLDSLGRSCGYRTGLFTSPHLVDYRERIRVSGIEIPEETCAAYLTELREISEQLDPHPTFFELTLACGMRYFSEKRCDLIILETGMGGRLDATTSVPTDVSVITPIGLDHTQWLGDTLTKVANEKAGIFREGKPAVSAAQERDAAAVLRQEANQTRSSLEFITEPVTGYPVSLPGKHQRENAALALAALYAIDAPLTFDSVAAGLGSAQHPGRFEIISPKSSQRSSDLIIDAAHNPHATRSLCHTWQETYREQKATLIFGAVAEKDITGIVDLLKDISATVHLVPVNSQRGLPAEELKPFFSDSLDLHTHDSVSDAIEATKESTTPVLLTGSLFLIGEVKARLSEQTHRSSAQ